MMLNPEQKQAVETTEGPVMVVAGPGTGKTHILTLRIARILQESDINPENILALTFTEAASQEMRERLVRIIGSPGYRASMYTFHGFCNSIIREFPEEFPDLLGASPAGTIEQVNLLKHLLENQSWEHIASAVAPLHHLKNLKSFISELKREGVSFEEYEQMLNEREEELRGGDVYHTTGPHKGKVKGEFRNLEKKIGKSREAVAFARMYQEELGRRRLYDYDDMISHVLMCLRENEGVLLTLRERYHYLLADEHQDANRSQNLVLELLCGDDPSPNLFIVGDEKQAIFRFQGASLENFAYFQKKFPRAKLVRLRKNYRSVQPILDLATSLMRGEEALQGEETKEDSAVTAVSCASADEEIFFVAESCKELLKQGVKDIAVLCRTNKDAKEAHRLLVKLGVEAVLEAEEDVLQDPRIRDIMLLLFVIGNLENDELLLKLLHTDLVRVEPLSVFYLVRRARELKCGLLEALKKSSGLPDENVFHLWYGLLSSWRKKSESMAFLDLLDHVVTESGFQELALSQNNAPLVFKKLRALIAHLRSILESSRKYLLQDALVYLDLLQEEGISATQESTKQEGVRVLTAHRSKGREFEAVFIIGANDGNWGGRRSSRQFLSIMGVGEDGTEEERKLFYVALTRAKKRVAISWLEQKEGGGRMLPTRFLEEMRQDRITRIQNPCAEAFLENQDALMVPLLSQSSQEKEKVYICKLFEERPLSVTALNTYLVCPWKFVYQSLIRVPRSQNPVQRFGTAVHATLREFFARSIQQKDLQKEDLLLPFERFMERQVFTPPEREGFMKRGRKALEGYYNVHEEWPRVLYVEARVPEVEVAGVKLTGMLDRVELLEGNVLRVVDYKTGRHKSRNEIEGKTKNSTGDMKRQLIFYKLLVDAFWEGRHTMGLGRIDFVEPDEKGRWRSEEFEISQEEVSSLKDTITKVAEDIRSLSFWDKRCQDEKCEFCALANRLGKA